MRQIKKKIPLIFTEGYAVTIRTNFPIATVQSRIIGKIVSFVHSGDSRRATGGHGPFRFLLDPPV